MKKAFTLIELLVVIAIIGLLAAILFPVFSRARENARRSSCQSNLKQIGLGIIQYIQDYDEKVPSAGHKLDAANAQGCPGANGSQHCQPWHGVIMPYVKSTQVFACPSNQQRTKIVNNSQNIWGTVYPKGIPYSYMCNGAASTPNPHITQIAPSGSPMDPFENDGTGGGAPMALLVAPSQTILVFENECIMTSYDPDFYDVARIKNNAPTTDSIDFTDHLNMCNYLFADGHVKALTPIATVTGGTMWSIKPSESATATGVGYFAGEMNRFSQ